MKEEYHNLLDFYNVYHIHNLLEKVFLLFILIQI